MSALCIALKSSIIRLLSEGEKFSCVSSASEGRFSMDTSHFDNDKTYLRINDMFGMFYDGIREIEKLYPGNVKLLTL